MNDCELLKTCTFFNEKMAAMPSTAEVIKGRYCREGNDGCARYQVYKSKGSEHVPQDLLPNHADGATRIIDEW